MNGNTTVAHASLYRCGLQHIDALLFHIQFYQAVITFCFIADGIQLIHVHTIYIADIAQPRI
ncbi:hypothetical protein D3C80_1876150 [compost metagenome]